MNFRMLQFQVKKTIHPIKQILTNIVIIVQKKELDQSTCAF
jgi:hypothetical protein